jgi:hypothetical protein
MKLIIKHTSIAVTLAMAAFGASATSLAISVPATSVDIVLAPFAGTLLDKATTIISNSSYSGVARSAVYDTGTGLDFYYQFSNDAASVNGIERFTGFDFRSVGPQAVEVFQTSAAFGIFSLGTESSDTADRTALGVIGFNFVPTANSKIKPGTTSYTQIIRTNARAYAFGNFGMIDGIGDNAAAFAPSLPLPPTGVVPEPESYALFLAGVGVFGVMRLRRRELSSQGR